MDQSDSDWGDWPKVESQPDVDAMLDDYKKESDPMMDSKPRANIQENERNIAEEDGASAYSDESDEDDHQMENQQPENGSQQAFYRGVREGLATCEFCGRVGIKHAFYSKSKRFCSLACSRSFSASAKENKGQRKNGVEVKPVQRNKTPQTLIQNKSDSDCFDWSDYLNDTNAVAAPVSCFRHVPMADGWDNITVGLKVEVLNTDCDLPAEVFWIATVIRLAGYRALMRYEGFGNDSRNDFWINLCIQDVHPVGWCASNGKPLVPPQTIQEKYLDWKDFLVKRLTGARTLPHNFYKKVQESLNDHPLKVSMRVEVVDRMCVSAMRVATVNDIIGGRLRLNYEDSKVAGDEFWCHRESTLVHPVGWSQLVGHKLHASAEYKNTSLDKIAFKKYGSNDASPDMFPKTKEPANGLKFRVGMKLEAIDPLNLSTICVATVMKVLRNNYLMIGIDGSMAENGQDWFCYHAMSPCIFPAGFCEINGLPLTPPRGSKGEFRWFDYLKQTKSIAAPVKLFQKIIPKHGFRSSMKVEAVDLMEPRLICVGTVVKVVGRLLRLHFDGWDSDYDQWIDCESPDIYPVGWCEMVGYHLEGPKAAEPQNHQASAPKKRKAKAQVYRGQRKKRKWKQGSRCSVGSVDTDEHSRDSLCTNDSQWGTLSTMSSLSSPTEHEPLPKQPFASLALDVSDARDDVVGPSSTESQPSKDMPILSPLSTGSIRSTVTTAENFMPALADSIKQTSPVATTTAHAAGVNKSPVTTLIASPVAASLPISVAAANPKSATVPAGTMLNLSPTKATIVTSPILSQKLLQTGITAASLTTPQKTGSVIPASTNISPLPSKLGHSPVYTLTSSIKSGDSSPSTSFGTTQVMHHIPRVIPGEPDKDSGYNPHNKDQSITPEVWSVYEVCQFLRVNDCGAYCDSFSKKSITGRKFMTLTKEQIVNLTGMKVGPSLKIYDLIQTLKITVASQSPPAGSTQSSRPNAPIAISQAVVFASSPPQHSPALKAQLTKSTGLPMS